MPKKAAILKNLSIFVLYLFIVWGGYRTFFRLPEEIEELIIKPLVWLIPVFFLIGRERAGLKSLGLTSNNLFRSVIFACGLGMVFLTEGLIFSVGRGGEGAYGLTNLAGILPSRLGILVATAAVEEITARGYIFSRLLFAFKSEWVANVLSSLVWTLLHLPLVFLVWQLPAFPAFAYLLVVVVFGVGSAFVFARTRNITSSILLRVFWELPLVLL